MKIEKYDYQMKNTWNISILYTMYIQICVQFEVSNTNISEINHINVKRELDNLPATCLHEDP